MIVVLLLAGLAASLVLATIGAASFDIAFRFGRIDAASRHAAWIALLCTSLAMPPAFVVFGQCAPSAGSAVPAPPQGGVVTVARAPMQTMRGRAHASPAFRLRVLPVPSNARSAVAFVLARVLALTWLLVALRYLASLVRELAWIARLKRQARETDIPLPAIARGARVLVATGISVPIAVGYAHPAIILPEAFVRAAGGSELQRVLLHEAAHLRRRDDWCAVLQQLCVAVLWFVPAVHHAVVRLRLERELACDDAVVAQTGDARGYAELLWRLFEARDGAGEPLLAAGAAGGTSQILARVQRLLVRPASVGGARRALYAVAALALAAGLGAAVVAPVVARATSQPSGTAIVALADGLELIVGGRTPDGTYLRSAELWNVRTHAVVAYVPMHEARADAAATLLRDGDVLVTGGWTPSGATPGAELFSHASRRFAAVESMTYARAGQTATLLRDGRVLIAGGEYARDRFVSTPEFFDPRTRRFQRAASDIDGRAYQLARLLRDGRVVLVSGRGPGGHTVACAIVFDPVTQRVTDWAGGDRLTAIV